MRQQAAGNFEGFGDALAHVLADESGQAITEYILLHLVAVIAIAAAFSQFQRVVGDYYTNVTRWLTLPIP